MKKLISAILDRLEIRSAECVYLHSSVGGLGLDISSTKAFLDAVIDLLGKDCTIFVPSFPFASSKEYFDYVNLKEIHFDSALTHCRVNMVGELFRRRSSAHRSLNPILPIAGHGPLAKQILHTAHLDSMPFGPNTVFSHLRKYRTFVVGLGLNSHTNSFIHVIDDLLLPSFPFKLYSENAVPAKLYENSVLMYSGCYHYILSEIRRSIRPERLHDLIKEKNFYKFLSEPGPCYALELEPYLTFGTEMGAKSFANQNLPAWYQLTNQKIPCSVKQGQGD